MLACALAATRAQAQANGAREPAGREEATGREEPASEAPDEPASEEPDEPASDEPEESDEPARGTDPLRAALWNLGALAGGTLWYVIDERNVLDWDFDNFSARFTAEAYRFDNNHFPINFIGHALSGAAFYALPRANGLEAPWAFLYAFMTSAVWEFVIEFQERFSINDQIVTPVAGMAIGEPAYRLGRYLVRHAHPALAWIFGLPVAIHEALDGRPVGVESGAPPPPPGTDIRMGYGFGWAFGPGAGDFDVHTVSAEGRFVALDGYLRPGAGVTGFFDAEVSSLRLEGFFGSTGMGFELDADVVWIGLHARDLREGADGLHGQSLILGSSVSYLYRFERFETWRDRLAFAGLPGLAADLEERAGAFAIRTSMRLQGMFGAAHADAFRGWEASHPGETPKTILQNHSYYFGWGWLVRFGLELELGPLELGGALRFAELASQEGLDRNQDRVTRDVLAADRLIELELWARLASAPAGLYVELAFYHRARFSVVDAFTSSRALSRGQLAAGLVF